jgi:hypothetical protein
VLRYLRQWKPSLSQTNAKMKIKQQIEMSRGQTRRQELDNKTSEAVVTVIQNGQAIHPKPTAYLIATLIRRDRDRCGTRTL